MNLKNVPYHLYSVAFNFQVKTVLAVVAAAAMSKTNHSAQHIQPINNKNDVTHYAVQPFSSNKVHSQSGNRGGTSPYCDMKNDKQHHCASDFLISC